jgi:hypothetical protein
MFRASLAYYQGVRLYEHNHLLFVERRRSRECMIQVRV